MGHSFFFKLHYSLTLYMTGVIWLIQVIHYPLFRLVGASSFSDYHKNHLRQTSLVIAIPMVLEMLTNLILLIIDESYRRNIFFLIASALLPIIWSVTFLISVPKHNILSKGMNDSVIHDLIKTNWIRTIGWSLRAALLFYLLN